MQDGEDKHNSKDIWNKSVARRSTVVCNVACTWERDLPNTGIYECKTVRLPISNDLSSNTGEPNVRLSYVHNVDGNSKARQYLRIMTNNAERNYIAVRRGKNIVESIAPFSGMKSRRERWLIISRVESI